MTTYDNEKRWKSNSLKWGFVETHGVRLKIYHSGLLIIMISLYLKLLHKITPQQSKSTEPLKHLTSYTFIGTSINRISASCDVALMEILSVSHKPKPSLLLRSIPSTVNSPSSINAYTPFPGSFNE